MKAFVVGATGYVGRAVVEKLRENGADVVGHVRPDSSRLQMWRQRFEAMGAEVSSCPFDVDAFATLIETERVDAVFALLGTTRARGDDYMDIDYGLTRRLLDAVLRQPPAARPYFVYLSSLGAGQPGRGAYLEARTRVEHDLTASGVDALIARPSFISGPGRDEPRPAERVAAVVSDVGLGLFGFFGMSRTRDRLGSIDNYTLAAGLVRAAAEREPGLRVLHSDGLRPKG